MIQAKTATPPDITPYCLTKSPDGFVCLRRKHPDNVPHTSADNRVVVDGKPGRIIEWTGDGMPGRAYREVRLDAHEGRAPRTLHAEPALPNPTLTQGEIAKASGYTGDVCGTCQSLKVRRNGSCLVCDECGTTTGCS